MDLVVGDDAFRVLGRSIVGHQCLLRLSNGQTIETRRFIPAGQGDWVRFRDGLIEVYARQDKCWVEIGTAWASTYSFDFGTQAANLTFKEIETAAEMALFDGLRKFHYRGGGGAGRTVPIIAKSDVWDLPSVLGFIEISSSMIANTARKRFFDFPYSESETGPTWQNWDRSAAKKYSNLICRISRFVIHPEIRGLGLAKSFMDAARRYSVERWHYGGYRPRFLEITADMLRYYKFVDKAFVYMGETEGNEHRLSKDMTYLVRKAMSEGEEMPQGGGGIMTLQRGYASQLMRYLGEHKKTLPEVVRSLRFDPSLLDQVTWESLHRLNRRPKLSYSSGLTPPARKYVELRRMTLSGPPEGKKAPKETINNWSLSGVGIRATVEIAQTSEARVLQDAFGFVGANLSSEIVQDLSFVLRSGELTLICGASGSGKSLLVSACAGLLMRSGKANIVGPEASSIEVCGSASGPAKVQELPALSANKIPLELKGRAPLEKFLQITAKCGLAEPQLFVRPIHSLSSGQRYRLRVALAFLSSPSIVIIDNFCEPLDRYTAIAVIRGIKNLALEFNVAVLAATAAYDRLQSVDDIDQTILLRRGDKAVVTQHDRLT